MASNAGRKGESTKSWGTLPQIPSKAPGLVGEKRKRGRPRKLSADLAPAEKLPRGRPLQQATGVEDPMEKRPRGRPRKDPAEGPPPPKLLGKPPPLAGVNEDAGMATVSPEKRPRGRPPKVPAANSLNAEKVPVVHTVKAEKVPGIHTGMAEKLPAAHKNKSGAQATKPQKPQAGSASLGGKRPRGRPRKEPLAINDTEPATTPPVHLLSPSQPQVGGATTEAKRRGRPPKDAEGHGFSSPSKVVPVGTTPEAKRPRGRPPKVTQGLSAGPSKTQSTSMPQGKRPRGRPPKAARPAVGSPKSPSKASLTVTMNGSHGVNHLLAGHPKKVTLPEGKERGVTKRKKGYPKKAATPS